MPDVRPGGEGEYRYLQRWLTFSERLDRLVEATEPVVESHRRGRVAAAVAARRPPRGFRAGLASGLARVAVSVHREAAARVALSSGSDAA